MLENALIGRELQGGYKVISPLGRGSFSEVYKAEDTGLGQRVVAIKIFTRPDLQTIDDIRTEAGMLAQFTASYHIVTCHAFGTYETNAQNGTDTISYPFLVLQYADLGTLRHVIVQSNSAPMPSARAVAYIKQAGDGIKDVHAAGLKHLDVKPENLLLNTGAKDKSPLTDDKQVFLSDFSLTRRSHTGFITAQRTLSGGTPAYMAKEQVEEAPVQASDQYALAAIAYELLTGQQLFSGNDREVLVQQVTKQPRVFIDIPGLQMNLILQYLEETVMKALAKEPGNRFITVSDFIAQLDENIIKGREDMRKGLTFIDTQAGTIPVTASDLPTLPSARNAPTFISPVSPLLQAGQQGLVNQPVVPGGADTAGQERQFPPGFQVPLSWRISLLQESEDFRKKKEKVRKRLLAALPNVPVSQTERMRYAAYLDGYVFRRTYGGDITRFDKGRLDLNARICGLNVALPTQQQRDESEEYQQIFRQTLDLNNIKQLLDAGIIQAVAPPVIRRKGVLEEPPPIETIMPLFKNVAPNEQVIWEYFLERK